MLFIHRRAVRAILIALILASLVMLPLTQIPKPNYVSIKGQPILSKGQGRLILVGLDSSALEDPEKVFDFITNTASYAQSHGFVMGLYFIGKNLTEMVLRTSNLENIKWRELDFPKSSVTNAAEFYRTVASIQNAQPDSIVTPVYIGSGILSDEADAIQLALAAKYKCMPSKDRCDRKQETKTEMFSIATKHANTEVLFSLASPHTYYFLAASPRANELFGGSSATSSSLPTIAMQPQIRIWERDGPILPISFQLNLESTSPTIPAGTKVSIQVTGYTEAVEIVLQNELDYESSKLHIYLLLRIMDNLQTPIEEITAFESSHFDIHFINPDRKENYPVSISQVVSPYGIRVPKKNVELIFGPLIRAWAGKGLLIKFILVGLPGVGKTCLLNQVATAFCPTPEQLGVVGPGEGHVTTEIVEYDLLNFHIGQACTLPISVIDPFGIEKDLWSQEFVVDLASGRLANGTTLSSLREKAHQAKNGAQLLSTPDFVVAVIHMGDNLKTESWEITATVTKWMTPHTTTKSNFVVISQVNDNNRGYLTPDNMSSIKNAMKVNDVDIFVVNAEKGVKSAENDIGAIKLVFSMLPAYTRTGMREIMKTPSRYYSGTTDTTISKWAVEFVNSYAWNTSCTYLTVFIVVLVLLIIAPDAIEYYLRRFPAAPANGGPAHGGGGGGGDGGDGGGDGDSKGNNDNGPGELLPPEVRTPK